MFSRTPLIQRFGLVMVTAVGATIATWAVHGYIHPNTTLPSLTYDLVVRDYSYESGELLNTTQVFRALRDDGSYVEVRSHRNANGTPYETHAIEDLRALKKSIVVPALRLVTSAPLTQKYADRIRRNGNTECGSPSGAERANIQGFDTFSVEQPGVERIRPGSKSWVAPALGCIPLRVEWSTGGKIVRTEEAENVLRTQPAQSLFTVPSDYQEVSPGIAMSQLHTELGAAPYNASGHIEKIAEDRYAKRRRDAGL